MIRTLYAFDSVLTRVRFPMVLLFLLTTGGGAAQNFADLKPSPQQVEWQDLEFGVIIHFGTNTLLDREWGDGTADPRVFNPSDLNVDQWMRAIRAMVKQAKQVVVVADSSKIGVVTPSLICPIEDVDVLVTDEGASEQAVAEFSRRGIKVIRA